MYSEGNEGATHTPPDAAAVLGSESSWSETALEWWQRSRRRRQQRNNNDDDGHGSCSIVEPKHPAAAARAFVKHFCPTRLPFWRLCQQQSRSAPDGRPRRPPHKRRRRRRRNLTPLVELSGSVAKTLTLITLAAHYVVQTRPSRFPEYNNSSSNDDDVNNDNDNNASQREQRSDVLPHVFILDAPWEICMNQIYKMVRSLLLCDYDNMATDAATTTTGTPSTTDHNNGEDEPTVTTTVTPSTSDRNNHHQDLEHQLAADCQECCSRIHVAYADENNSAGWLPILESLFTHLQRDAAATPADHHHRHHPTLVLWDGLGTLPTDDLREMQRVLLRRMRDDDDDGSRLVLVAYTTPLPLQRHLNNTEWDDRVTHRVRFEPSRRQQHDDDDASHHDFVAYNGGTRSGSGDNKNDCVAFSITAAGIRS